MDRTADYTIQGFLYQFNKTLLEILNSGSADEVTVEGIVEDIEIRSSSDLTAIQCKYHESKVKFSFSTIYKPLLQMMQHFQANQNARVAYALFAHFPNPPTNISVGKAELEDAINSTNKDLLKYCDELRGKVDLNKFLLRFRLIFGESYDELTGIVHAALVSAGIPKIDIEPITYPNAIQIIANLSIKHDANDRRISRTGLLKELRRIKSTAISRWTLALKTKKQILEAKRRQLKLHLGVNARIRCLLIDCASLEDFDSEIVGFVCEFLAKYHSKQAHVCTPILCLDAIETSFQDIQLRLYRKGVRATDGFVGAHFEETLLFRDPIVVKSASGSKIRREFSLRILRWESNGSLLAKYKPDDIYICGANAYPTLDVRDVSVESLHASTLKEIAYLTNVSNSYE